MGWNPAILGVGSLTSDRRVTSGVGGLVLAALGIFLVGDSTGGLFLLGVVLLVAGVALLVRLLLLLTESGSEKGGAPSARAGGRSRLIDLGAIKKIPAMSQWVSGAAMGLLSLFGLFLYGRAADGMFATFGGLLFLFGLAVIIVFVHNATDYSGAKTEDQTAEGSGHS